MLTEKEEQELLKLLEMEEEERRNKDFKYFAANNIFITNKKGQKVNLILNNVQTQVYNKIKELQIQGIPPRLIILKSRQMGASTGIQGLLTKETTSKENRNGFIVSHEDDSTSAIFQKTKYMYDNLPDNYRPLQKASNAKELIFDTPLHYDGQQKGLHSKIEIKTAGNSGIGRSETRHYVHLSEYAFWKGSDANAPDKQLSGILQAVPDDIDTWVIIESTANGMNTFYDLWQDAVKGNNGFVPLFFPWYVHEEYKMQLTESEESFIKSMNDYEKWLYNEMNLSLDRVKWWRETKKQKCNNDLNQMKQENPTTPEEAFIFSGTPVFDVEIIQQRIEVLRIEQEKKPPKRGYFIFCWNNAEDKDKIIDSSIKFVESNTGAIKIYEDVKSGYPYVIGGDTKGEGSDLFAATVINNVTGIRVATLHQDMDPDEYTHQVYCLGRYYNEALINIETNFDIYPVKELQRLHYPRQYTRQQFDTKSNATVQKYGWRTDENTRPFIISQQIELLRDHPELFNDIIMLKECITFVKDKNGRPDAMSSKHDDLLLSDMIGNAARSQQTFKIKEQPKKIPINELTGYYTQEELQDKGYTKYEIKQYLAKNIKPWGNR